MNIQDNYIIPHHSPLSEELCINGVLYYQAFTGITLNESAIMSFDVGSEKLALIKGPFKFRTFSKLTSYEGKLAVVFFEKKISGIIALWVLEDSFKEEWSKKTFVMPAGKHFDRFRTTNTDTGEIVYTPIYEHASQQGAAYFDLKNDSVRNFNIEGITDKYMLCQSDSVSAGQVENLMFL